MTGSTPICENTFNQFIRTYYKQCRLRFPKIQAIAGKWTFEDLIPGLSDFDTRFICSDDMSDEDWCRMSSVVGEVHLQLCEQHPEWSRILEHLPGVNPTWNEFMNDFSYYPEYNQWSFYYCNNKKKLEEAKEILRKHEWDIRDEYFFLKKFLTFYGPYNRSIDPAINVGAYEDKYPLHSRIMHYFTPAVQAALSIINKKPIKGKFETLRIAKEMFPDLKVFNEIFNILDVHYEVPELYVEPELSYLEDRLFSALKVIREKLEKHITLVPENALYDIKKWWESLGSVPISPQLKVFDSSKFSRLFKGRMHFYSKAPVYFDNLWLTQNELSRVGDMFYRIPYCIYWDVKNGERINDPDTIIQKLVPAILTNNEADATLEFSRLTPGTWEEGKEVKIAAELANIFDDFFKGLCKIRRDLDSQ